MRLLGEVALTSTLNLCFGAKNSHRSRLEASDFRRRFSHGAAHIKVGYEGVYISQTCFPDDYHY